jgi:nitrile hydratase accessory protein
LNRPDPALEAALAGIAPIPRDAGGPVFAEPWQAQAFALTLQLHSAGLFTWAEWAEALGSEIREHLQHGGCTDGSDYYERWCEALEHIVVAKGASSHKVIDETSASWIRAAEATPHGMPILRENDPLFAP